METAIIHDMPQGSESWHRIRLMKITASNFKTAMSKGVGRGKLQDDLVEEYLTQKRKESFCTDAMRNGVELESEARDEYEFHNGCKVAEVGFVEVSEYIGASPDGLVGEHGGLEIKCIIPSTLRKILEGKKKVSDYLPQIDGNMWATGRKWWDLVLYCPEAVKRRYWSTRIPRDELRTAEIDVKINAFAGELKSRIDKLKKPTF